MAYNEENLPKLKALKELAQRMKADVAAAVNAKVSSAYKPGGSVTFASLPELSEANLGVMVNVTDKFATTDSFVEGAGIEYPAGTNVAVVKVGEAYKYDAMSGIVDLTGYVRKEYGKGLSANDYTTDEKTKLAGISEGATKVEIGETAGHIKINGTDTAIVDVASDAEVAEMLTEVFGQTA